MTLAKKKQIVDPISNTPFEIKWDSAYYYLPDLENHRTCGYALLELIIDQHKKITSYRALRYMLVTKNDTIQCNDDCDRYFGQKYDIFLKNKIASLHIVEGKKLNKKIEKQWRYQIKINFK